MPTDAALLAAAAADCPPLRHRDRRPVGIGQPVRDPQAFQGWRFAPTGPAELPIPLTPGETVVVDLGEHLVGRLQLRLGFAGRAADAPVRLELIVAEIPAELGDPIDPFTGGLSRAWFQDEVAVIEDLPAAWSSPRRFAGRYVAIRLASRSPAFAPRIDDLIFVQEGAEVDDLVADPDLPADLATIDLVARRTLRNCLFTVFEDGPKRDRRLWLGDLRLQALADSVTSRRYDVVRRSLSLLTAFSREDGLIGVCCYERPEPRADLLHAVDYNLLLMPTIEDHANVSGDLVAVRTWWPVACRQLDLVLGAHVDVDLYDPTALAGVWSFIDWNERVSKRAPTHGVLVYALRSGARLAETLGDRHTADRYRRAAERFTAGARRAWLRSEGLLATDDGQISWATQAWMILAGVLDPEEGRRALQRLSGLAEAVRPVAPYCWHHVVQAYLVCGMDAEALALIRAYWGGMVAKGADTFWEVYDPDDERRSPYGTHLLNSACHAWSCTPTWFLRAYRDRLLAHA